MVAIACTVPLVTWGVLLTGLSETTWARGYPTAVAGAVTGVQISASAVTSTPKNRRGRTSCSSRVVGDPSAGPSTRAIAQGADVVPRRVADFPLLWGSTAEPAAAPQRPRDQHRL